MKRLYLLRHAKTELGSAVIQDHERALVERGKLDATQLGLWLNREMIWVDRVVSSSSVRTRQTMEHLSLHWKGYSDVTFSDSLYLSSAGDMLATIQSFDEAQSSVLLIGHNPGIHQLALILTDKAHGNDLDEMEMNFPTSAMAVVTFGESLAWRNINPQSGTLEAFLTRHDITDALAA